MSPGTATPRNTPRPLFFLPGAAFLPALAIAATTPGAQAAPATVAPAAAAPRAAQVSGQATWYNTGLGACGWYNNDSELVVAISAALYGSYPNPNNSPQCGRQLRVNGPLGSVTVTVVDRCTGCATNDVDLSPTAFSRIGDLNAGRINVSWDWV